MAQKTVLLTGYGGFLAKHIAFHLRSKGYLIKGLSQNKNNLSDTVFYWNVRENFINEEAVKGIDYVIHLAGAGIADKRWTEKRKKEIINSRVDSSALLAHTLQKNNVKLKGFIGASGAGFYGAITNENLYTESSLPGRDFIAECCVKWENSYLPYRNFTERLIILRLGTVIGKDEGFLKKMLPIVKLGLGSPLGNGEQYMSWIYVEDLTRLVEFCLSDNSIDGTYNAVASEQIRNKVFMQQLAKSLHSPFFMPAVPGFILNLIFGQIAHVLLNGVKVSNQKIMDAGFTFSVNTIQEALDKSLN
jgi:uncharacterized protein (TIGR01777 family)